MKLQKALFANMLLAGSLLAIPAFAAENMDATIASGSTTTVLSQAPTSEKRQWKRGPKMTDDQLTQMAALKDKYALATSAEKAKLGSLSRQLKASLAKSDINRTEVLSIQSQINSVRNDLSTKRMNNKLDFIAILTPEQKEKFQHRMLVSNAFGGHHGRGGHGAKGGRGFHGGRKHFGGKGGFHRGLGRGNSVTPSGAKVGFEQQGTTPIAFDAPVAE